MCRYIQSNDFSGGIMPTYEYECLECKHRFDVFHSIKDDPVSICEKCGKEVKRVIGPAGIIFKGSGFYVNDYKKGGEPVKSAPKSEACSGCPSAGGCD